MSWAGFWVGVGCGHFEVGNTLKYVGNTLKYVGNTPVFPTSAWSISYVFHSISYVFHSISYAFQSISYVFQNISYLNMLTTHPTSQTHPNPSHNPWENLDDAACARTRRILIRYKSLTRLPRAVRPQGRAEPFFWF